MIKGARAGSARVPTTGRRRTSTTRARTPSSRRLASSAPTLVDPIASVREQLASGGAEVAGTTTIDGVSLYKIELPTGVIAYFDTTGYRPMYLDNPHQGSFVRTRVETYEELPITATTAKLLSITAQHPQARVETRDAPVK